MPTITTAIRVQDAVTPAFHSMSTALNIVLNGFEAMQTASSKAIDTVSIQTARQELANANVIMQQVEENAKNVNNQTEKMPQGFEKANNSANNLLKTLMGFSVIQKIGNLVTGQVSNALDRMDTLNNYPKVMSNLGIDETQANASKQMMVDKLQGLPTTLNDAVSAVQNFTSVNGNVGASTKMFLALNNAILAGGGSTQVQQSALEQLLQAYAKGKPDMMEWRTAMTAMPAQLRQVAKAMGYVDANTLGENLRAGKVSMNDFMNTFIKLNEQGIDGFQSFEQQARNATGGFATSIANMKSAITRGITNIIDNINNSLEGAGLPTIQVMIQNVGSAIEKVLSIVGKVIGKIIIVLRPLFDIIQNIYNFIVDNWSWIGPMLATIIPIIMAVVGAIKIWSVAQAILNSTMWANPITWIIIAIVVLIGAVFGIIAIINKVTKSSISAVGVIMGVIYTLGAFINNTFIVPVWNAVAYLVNFFANCFKDPVTSIKILFADMALWVLKKVKSMIEGIENLINLIPGVKIDITSGINNFISKIEQGIDKAKESMGWEDVVEYKEKIELQDAYAKGYAFGEKLEKKVANMFKNGDNKDKTGYEDLLNSLNNNMNTTAENTGSIKNSLDVTEEDLKYLRDIAERETINRFTTAEIKVDFTSNNNINSELDIDGIVDSLGEKLEERLAVVAEGVYV